MILDALLQFSGTTNPTAGQSLAVGPSTVTSTNVIDLAGVGVGNTARDLGQGNSLEIMIEVIQAFAGGTSMQVQLVCADDAGISVNVTTIVIDGAVPLANLTAGALLPLHWDRVAPFIARRYIALQYIILGTMTAGSVNSFVVTSVQDKGNNTLFNSGFSVS
ncbi:Bbp16 family capsid cement protein [Pseudomonas sp.]|uniref:Bbp16 family capsid cement protein n=1 Tax=Pseudomonas sp. TaxID=306 RepID=UPI003FD73CC3